MPVFVWTSAAEVRFGPVLSTISSNAEPDCWSGSGKEGEPWTGPLRTRSRGSGSSSGLVQTSEPHNFNYKNDKKIHTLCYANPPPDAVNMSIVNLLYNE